ncbi:MAG TPA: cytochrome b/b6 domain-containing protein [Dongiaceae bacterium]|nr:cytochrome b/b6 domain-containing protein [Dongiaceae bacterium]
MMYRSLFRSPGFFLATLLALLGPLSLVRAEIPNDKCLECHSDKDLTKKDAKGKEVSIYVDAAKLAASSHRTNTCASCHSDLTEDHPDNAIPAKPVDCARCHQSAAESYSGSVHGLALKAGDANAATCIDCHGTHDVLPPTDPESPLHYTRLGATCGQCHTEAAADVAESIHGQAVAAHMREAPTCTDCHSEHKIEALKGQSLQKRAEQICGKCHASERINAKFHMPNDRVKTFFESYHGLAVQGGSASAANCASCHGYHKILPSSDPRSSVNPQHLVATCGKCHPGATENFAQSRVHINDLAANDHGAVVNRWVRRVYLALIFTVVGGLAGHNLLAWLRAALAARRARGVTVTRMNRKQRLQHFILLSSFILLALTGFALKYPDTWLAWLFGGDENIRRWIHRIAGLALLSVGFYHLLYLVVTREGRQLLKDFWPRWQDLKDVILNVRYLTRRSSQRPRFGRFGYAEKMEYWAVIWGTIIMGVTGLMIWFKMEVTEYVPRWVVDVAITVHYYEAILACLAIIVWHFYHVIFAPDVYPMNWAWWDGQVSEEWEHEEHPLDHSTPPPGKDSNTTGVEI